MFPTCSFCWVVWRKISPSFMSWPVFCTLYEACWSPASSTEKLLLSQGSISNDILSILPRNSGGIFCWSVGITGLSDFSESCGRLGWFSGIEFILGTLSSFEGEQETKFFCGNMISGGKALNEMVNSKSWKALLLLYTRKFKRGEKGWINIHWKRKFTSEYISSPACYFANIIEFAKSEEPCLLFIVEVIHVWELPSTSMQNLLSWKSRCVLSLRAPIKGHVIISSTFDPHKKYHHWINTMF